MSNSLGTLTPILVAQEALPILTDNFPLLAKFSTDFSNEGVLFGQQVISRIPQLTTVSDFDTTNGYVAGNGTLTDVPVTINKHRFTAVSFNDQELSSTRLDLVQQFASSLAAQVGNDLMSGISALFTTGNYASSVSVASGSLITRDNGIVAAKKALDVNKVPQNDRFFITSPVSDNELLQDESLVKPTWGAPGIQTSNIPNAHGFSFGQYTSLPTTNNLIAVAAQKAAVVIAGRAPEIPSDLYNVPIPGKVQNVVDEKTGFTIQVRESYDMVRGKYQVTYAWMYGCAVGSPNSLVRITRAGG